MARSSPARSATNRPGWDWPRMDRAASRSPAAQPSVRRHSVSSSSPDSATPWSASSAAVSSRVKARSASRISLSCPATRSRCRASGGSERVATTRRSCEGACRSRNRSWPTTAWPVASCRSSRISTTGRRSSNRPATKACRNPSPISTCGLRPASSPSGGTTSAPRSAASTCAQNCGGWWSPGPTRTQATGPGGRAPVVQEVISRVLPYPAGAASRVSGPRVPSSSSPNNRCRATGCQRGTGTISLVVSSPAVSVASVASVGRSRLAEPPLVLLLTGRDTVWGGRKRDATALQSHVTGDHPDRPAGGRGRRQPGRRDPPARVAGVGGLRLPGGRAWPAGAQRGAGRGGVERGPPAHLAPGPAWGGQQGQGLPGPARPARGRHPHQLLGMLPARPAHRHGGRRRAGRGRGRAGPAGARRGPAGRGPGRGRAGPGDRRAAAAARPRRRLGPGPARRPPPGPDPEPGAARRAPPGRRPGGRPGRPGAVPRLGPPAAAAGPHRRRRPRGGLRAYDRYRRVMAEELGVGPSPDLEAAYLELLHAEPAAGDPGPPPPGPVPGAFVGRGPELRRLRAAWDDARGGGRRTVLVAGEAGIGKTRLVTELASLAESDGAVVLAGRCDPHLGVPHLPLREAVGRHLAGYPSERLRALLGPRAAELARFWPELAWRLPALPPPSPVDPEAEQYLLFEALTGLLAAIAVGGPLLLLVDDLHGADEASLLLLRSLAQARRPARLLTVLTYRDDERAPRARLTAALGDLVRAPGAELLTLDGLQTDEVALLAAATTARPPGPGAAALAHVLRQRTAGNPFLVGELLRHLVETGALDGGDVTAVAAGPAVDDVPESVRWVVGQRLARLGGPVEHVLGVAAVIGYQPDVALVGRVVELGYDSLLSAFDTAVAARLLEERPGVPGGYAFHHPIVRDFLYRRLPAGERARAHRRVAQALEELTGGTSRLGELADHLALAGAPSADRAVDHARRAGEEAFAQRRYEESALRHRQALAVLERAHGAGAEPERRGRLLLGQGDAWAAAGQDRPATEAYLRAAAAARAAGSAEQLARAALGLGGATGFWSVGLNPAAPEGLLGEALEAAGPGGGRARALLLARLAS